MYRHPLPSEGAMGEGYESRCGFPPVLHHFGLFFLETEDEIYACLFKTIIEEIEPRNCHANTCTKVSEREGFAIIFEEQSTYLPGNVTIPNAKTVWIQ